MKAQCPNCQTRFKAPDSYAGKTVKCLKCKNSFTIELPEPEKISLPVPLNVLPILPTKHRGNFFIKLWNNSPVVFRNAFLATLGVLSALLFAYYVIRVPKFVSKGTTSQEQKAEIMPASSSDMRLAACIVLQHYMFKFDTLSAARVKAANEFLHDEAGLYAFLSVIKITESQLEDLYLQVHKLKMPDDNTSQICYQNLLNAIDTEYAFQKSMLPLLQNPDNLRIKSNFNELSEKAIATYNKASILTIGSLSEIDPDLWKKMCYIYNNKP